MNRITIISPHLVRGGVIREKGDMKISITIKKKNPAHITFQVFINGGLSGELILRNEEWEQFMEILQPNEIRDETN